MKKVFVVMAVLALLGLSMAASAEMIHIDTVAVGNPGNAADARVMATDGTSGYGSVDHTYNIGKYEVTAGQYCTFLNAVAKTDAYGLYSSYMWSDTCGCKIQQSGTAGDYSYSVASDYANRPVNYVNFWDACRFTNWLSNGQKNGAQDATTTERGTYTLDGYTGINGRDIRRNANWQWAVTSEDEWYKAAYYKGGGTNAGYWLYPTQSDIAPSRDMSDPSGNNANYYNTTFSYPIDNGKYTTVVGEFQNSASAYGTFDQGGNVWEWNEAIPWTSGSYAIRGLRGGSFYILDAATSPSYETHLQSSDRDDYIPTDEVSYVGFRVVQAVPEPSSLLALVSGLGSLIAFRRRRA